jgi:hypothetical protein
VGSDRSGGDTRKLPMMNLGDDLRDGLYVALDPWASNLFDLTAVDAPEG